MSESAIPERPSVPGFRPVPRTGVIHVVDRARQLGFRAGVEGWCNLGQGQPETGPLPGAPPRPTDVHIAADDYEYAPVGGIDALRRPVANLYNARYRQGQSVAMRPGECRHLRRRAVVAHAGGGVAGQREPRARAPRLYRLRGAAGGLGHPQRYSATA